MFKLFKISIFLFSLFLSSNAMSRTFEGELDSLPIEITIYSYHGFSKLSNPGMQEITTVTIGQIVNPNNSNANKIETIGWDVKNPTFRKDDIAFLPKGTLDRQRLAPFLSFINNGMMFEKLRGSKFRINREGAPEIEFQNGQIINESNIDFIIGFVKDFNKVEAKYIKVQDKMDFEIIRLTIIENKYQQMFEELLKCEGKQDGLLQVISMLENEHDQTLNRNGQVHLKSSDVRTLEKDRSSSSSNSE